MRNGPLTWTTSPGQGEGTTILHLDGPWTLENSAALQQELVSLRPPVLVMDMRGVPYIDSAGVGDLMQAHVSAGNAGRTLVLASVTNHVMALFYLIKVHNVLRTYPTVAEAEAAAVRRKKR